MKEFSDKLLSIYTGELSGINLTRILESEDFYQKQVLDSVVPVQEIQSFYDAIIGANHIVDIGFGGGFPIVPLAYLYKTKSFIGFEARKKKVQAVQRVCSILNLKNVQLFHERVENIFFLSNTVVTFKAVGTVDKFLPMINCEENVKIFFYKAKNFYTDETLEPIKGFKLICNEQISIPGKDEITRYVIGYQSIVPRGTKKRKKII